MSQWMKDVDLFDKELLLIPIHLETHWCLATVDFKLKQFRYYDSLKGINHMCLQLLREYIEHKAFDLKSSVCNFSEWTNVFHNDLPQQSNNSDCGIFLCMYARCLSERSPFSFAQSDIPFVRKHVTLELLCKKLF